MRRNAAMATLLMLGVWIAGCGSQPSSDKMIPENLSPGRSLPGTCTLTVMGGKEAQSKLTEQFRQAIDESLRKASLFTDVVDVGGDYHLLVSLHQLVYEPGFKGGTRMTSKWTLSRSNSRAVLWQKLIVRTVPERSIENMELTVRDTIAIRIKSIIKSRTDITSITKAVTIGISLSRIKSKWTVIYCICHTVSINISNFCKLKHNILIGTIATIVPTKSKSVCFLEI